MSVHALRGKGQEAAAALVASRAWSSPWLALALIPGLTFAIFAPVLTAWFIADDFRHLINMRDWPLSQWLEFSLKPTSPDYFRPLFKLGMLGLYEVFGGEAMPYHALAVGLHAVNGFLVFLLARRLFRSALAPWLASLLFVAHPAYLWQATMFSGLNEPLSVFFVLLAFLALPRPAATPSWQRHGLALLSLTLALLAKESTVLMPAVAAALFLSWAGLNRGSLRQMAPYAALMAIYLLFRLVGGASLASHDYDLGTHGLANLRKYLGLLAFPWLHFFGNPTWDVQRAVAGAVPALVLWLALRRGIFQAGLLGIWLGAALAPYIFFEFATPRYLYLAGTPFALLVAAAWDASEGSAGGRAWIPLRLGASWLAAIQRGAIIGFAFFLLAAAVWQMSNITSMYDAYEEFRGLVQEALPQRPPAGSSLIIQYPADFPNPLWGADMNRSAFVWVVKYLYPGVSKVTFVGPVTGLSAMGVTVVPPEVTWDLSYSAGVLRP